MPTMTTRPRSVLTTTPETLLLALDLGNTTWKLGFRAGGPATPPGFRATPARDLAALAREITAAKERFRLSDEGGAWCTSPGSPMKIAGISIAS